MTELLLFLASFVTVFALFSLSETKPGVLLNKLIKTSKFKGCWITRSPLENPKSDCVLSLAINEDVTRAISAIMRMAILSSETLVDSDKSVPTHSHPSEIASGLSVSRSTVFPTPRNPVITAFSMMVFCLSNLRISFCSIALPAKYGGICPAPGLKGFSKICIGLSM